LGIDVVHYGWEGGTFWTMVEGVVDQDET